jgi:hypothetical protein
MPRFFVEAAADAMEGAADEVVQRMRALAPANSGNLKDAIKWTWGDAPKGALRIDEIRSGARAGQQYLTLRLTIYVDRGKDGAFYAHFLEFGTQPHALERNASVKRGLRQDAGGKHPGTVAQPFFYPGWRAQKAAFMRKVRHAIRVAVREHMNGP